MRTCLQTELKKRKVAEEKSAFGTYASNLGETFTYRVKKAGAYGGYEVITTVRACLHCSIVSCSLLHLRVYSQKTDKPKTREELLEMRSKQKADRHCM